MKIKIFRSGSDGQEIHYDSFTIRNQPGLTVLAALFEIKERFDETLTFRYSCRGAVCGTCGMLINKVPRLACRTQISSLLEGNDQISLVPYPALVKTVPWNPRDEVLVEPLPHLPVIRDLVVDMAEFFSYYGLVEPLFRPAGKDPDKERLMDPADVKALELYTNCILCAACFGACPINAKNPRYLGPAALAKLYRFHIDPREARDSSRLFSADFPDGWWACRFHGNCAKVCPKDVPPNIAIGNARKELMKMGKRTDQKRPA
jgi:succinate dehydrogenase / fumarate reductase, iron-sulfur subunit